MVDKRHDDLNDTNTEAPGGSQATHSAADSTDASDNATGRGRHPRARVADTVDRAGETLERHALEMELKDGVRAKAAPAVRRASRAADVGAAYVREKDIGDMRADLESGIRQHPLKSIALALGAGYLLAKILD